MAEGPLLNWAGNHAYAAAALHRPSAVEQLQELVAGAEHVKALGSRHSFNDAADSPGALVSVAGLPQEVRVAADRRTVRVAAGMRYGELAQHLQREGLALQAMASLPHLSVAGAVATATHGSGDRHGNLSTAVRGLELVRGDGEIVVLGEGLDGADATDDGADEPAADLQGAVVGLGALGVVVAVILAVVPTYTMRQDVYEHLGWDHLVEHLDDITGRATSTSFFTRWDGDAVSQVWLKSRLDGVDGAGGLADEGGGGGPPPAELFGATAARVERHPLPGQSAATCTPQLGAPGPWHERLPHFRLEFTPSAGAEVQAEYLVERTRLPQVVEGLRPLAPLLDPLLIMSELRTVARDELWLSPAHGRDVLAVHFTFVRDQPAVEALLPAIEAVLLPLGARPHWAKLFVTDAADLAGRYERWEDFRALVRRYDPRGVFANAFLQRVGLVG